ncbi:BUD31 [Candida margitis]|uniref:BUD31 n=1 Tax=Candida margitis TaxID=1775924 RepID=UPI0022272CDD|nr:BUD31 [Candida margitis]KAI5968779.1 BUD31 [Candida margitis]
MPRSSKSKIKKTSPPPPGYDKIAPTIFKYKQKLKSATTNTSTTPNTTSTAPGTKPTSLWPIYKITHDVTRYVHDLYARSKISDELYTWLTLQDYVDASLISKWNKRGYEKLCCTQCINAGGAGRGGGTCICRVPKVELLKRGQDDKVDVECVTCGCRGCASSD